MTFIQNLKDKSEKQKKLIVFFIVGGIMFIVFIVWLFQFQDFLKNREEIQNEDFVPMAELTSSIKGIYEGSVEKINKLYGIIEGKE